MRNLTELTDLIGKFEAIEPPLQGFIKSLHEKYRPLNEGVVSDYLPELAKANPDWFSICVVSADGKIYQAGDTDRLFTMQSISKPFVYGLALEDRGSEEVVRKIGVEPTGDPVNSILEHEELTEGRYNPMVNIGAIATTSLIAGSDPSERNRRLLEMFRRYVGREVSVDESTYISKKNKNNLHRAMAYMMLNFGTIAGNIEEILDLYCQQCSLMVNCRELAIMAATLANGGVNPITGERAIASQYVKNLLSVMYTCGMYDFSGQWAYRVGFPAKSGLAGAILGVVPRQMGIAVFSPPLGEHRKSERGVKVFEELAERFNLHVFHGVSQEVTVGRCERGFDRPPRRSDRAKLGNKTLSTPYLETEEERDRSGNGIHSPFQDFLEQLHQKYLPLRDGTPYLSEPDLVEINPDWFGICAVTVDGDVYAVGDYEQPFLIQSISKVFAYGMALSDRGRDYVLQKVDVEPTGDAYNSIVKVEESSKRPHNPMVNAGAIATTNLILGNSPAKRLNRVLEMYKRFIGHKVFVDTPTFVSEQHCGDRNWAISYLLRNFGMIEGSIGETLDLYLQQCSAIVNCRDLAVMGATLANNGINPMTGTRAIAAPYVRDFLSVMYTCGMYDFAGAWVYNVGFPAKSGVGGGIIAVVPGQMGIAVFSPPLDKRGNSVRGIKVFEELSQRFGLHIFDPTTSVDTFLQWMRETRT
ncbi:glutaminase A [Oxynema aestuarii]|uniref:Glutaminase n=1 Tax=Oxynema aestuarii AP17 TaxID=2064643 RepID=A0A6H1TYE6_9CYAN|nr:glutaminase A [Oxynema aestuarii]QIZ71604.1 glutaminase A [Oxynema aestuarii AP17]